MELEILLMLGILAIILFVLMVFDRNKQLLNESKNNPIKKEEDWVIRHKARSKRYDITHKKGTRVVAENKNGIWKEGQIIGDHDWSLFTFFFVVKFDDGEIIKQEESKVSLI